MFMPGNSKYCSPYCKFFRCQRRALLFRGNKRLCGITAGDDCDPLPCQFSSCAINKLILPEGICGLWQEKHKSKRRTIDISEVEDFSSYRVKGARDLFP